MPISKEKDKNSSVLDARKNLQHTMVSLITTMYVLTSDNQMINQLLPLKSRRSRRLIRRFSRNSQGSSENLVKNVCIYFDTFNKSG